MKILLVDPPHHYLQSPTSSVQVHPLALGYLSAALSGEHEVVQLVCDVKGVADPADPWKEIGDVIAAQKPDLVGITCVTALFPAGLQVARLVRERLGPGTKVVMGGVHPTFLPEQAFDEPAVDFVIRGEGEAAMVELARALQAGRSWTDIGSLLWRDADGQIQRGPNRAPIADLDTLPFPERDNVLWSEHVGPSFYQSIITVRGCPYKCIYCSVPNTDDRKTRYRSATNIADEIAQLVDRYDIPYLFFHDSVFTLNRKRTVALCEQLIERGLTVPFACQTRADRVNPELLALMKAAGCHQVFYGIESGDTQTLRLMKKKMSLETIRTAVRHTKDLGIRCTGFFMVGFPWETQQMIERTADFATDLGLDAISLFSATPLPGTELWDMGDGQTLPSSIDFRAPQITLTSMALDDYAALFGDIKKRVTAYNVDQMYTGQMKHWHRG